MLRRLLYRNEFLVGIIIVALSLVIGVINPNYFSLGNVFGILRSATVLGIFAIGVMVVLIAGGIDVSFTAVAIFAMYTTVKILLAVQYEGTILLAFLMAGSIGMGLGLINAFFISIFRLPTLIVTLGTLSLFRGFMLFFIGAQHVRTMPPSMNAFSQANLLTIPIERGTVNLHASILITLFVALLTWAVLRYTMLGRGIYALGGDREAAERAGFNIRQIEFTVYAYVGLLAGIGGVIFGSLLRQANPFSIVGTELDVIAAAVLGGASIMGGRGTVIGTLLGVLLITIVNNSLVLVGIPSSWQRVFIGLLILIGTGLPAIQRRRSEKRLSATVTT